MKKRILTAFLVTTMAVSVSTTAFTATVVPDYVDEFLGADNVKQINYEYGTFPASSVTAQKTETLPFVEATPQMAGEGDLTFVDVVGQKEISYAAVPVGTVPSVIPAAGYQFAGSTHTIVNYFTKNNGGVFTKKRSPIPLQNGGTFYTIPATPAGELIAIQASVMNFRGENPEAFYAYSYVDSSAPALSFQVIGTTQPTTTPVVIPAVTGTCESDTGKHPSIKTNSVYQFRITSLNSKQPTFSVAGSSFEVTLNGKHGGDYLYLVRVVGKAGQHGGTYINGKKTASTAISIAK